MANENGVDYEKEMAPEGDDKATPPADDKTPEGEAAKTPEELAAEAEAAKGGDDKDPENKDAGEKTEEELAAEKKAAEEAEANKTDEEKAADAKAKEEADKKELSELELPEVYSEEQKKEILEKFDGVDPAKAKELLGEFKVGIENFKKAQEAASEKAVEDGIKNNVEALKKDAEFSKNYEDNIKNGKEFLDKLPADIKSDAVFENDFIMSMPGMQKMFAWLGESMKSDGIPKAEVQTKEEIARSKGGDIQIDYKAEMAKK